MLPCTLFVSAENRRANDGERGATMEKTELERNNTCTCGKMILLMRDRVTGGLICTGSHADRVRGIYHTLQGCRPLRECQ